MKRELIHPRQLPLKFQNQYRGKNHPHNQHLDNQHHHQ